MSLIPEAPSENISAFYDRYNVGGNTSVANDSEDIYKWSGKGIRSCEGFGYFDQQGNEIPYIKRDRDLGQTFEISSNSDVFLKSITVMTGFGTNVVRPGTYGQAVALQILEVSGKAEINDNGTSGTMLALHGFPHDRYNQQIPSERDDYIVDEKYKTMVLLTGGVFPGTADFSITQPDLPVNPDNQLLKGRFLKFSFTNDSPIRLQKNKKYAFLIFIVNRADNNGFTLANSYTGNYEKGHGIRRDGNGKFPPVKCEPTKEFLSKANRKAYKSALFPANLKERARIQPGTNGYPDVDTWSDLVFYIETQNID